MSTEPLKTSTASPATTYFIPLVILFIGLILSTTLQIVGLFAQQEQLEQTKLQLQSGLEQADKIEKFSENFFQDIVTLAPHSAAAARIQTAYNIRVKAQAGVTTPPVSAPAASAVVKPTDTLPAPTKP